MISSDLSYWQNSHGHWKSCLLRTAISLRFYHEVTWNSHDIMCNNSEDSCIQKWRHIGLSTIVYNGEQNIGESNKHFIRPTKKGLRLSYGNEFANPEYRYHCCLLSDWNWLTCFACTRNARIVNFSLAKGLPDDYLDKPSRTYGYNHFKSYFFCLFLRLVWGWWRR